MTVRTRAERLVRAALQRRGYALVGYTSADYVHLRRAEILREARVDLVLDVGANEGGYGRHLRDLGYTGRIVSFEPEGAAFGRLSERAAGDATWSYRREAVGAEDGTITLTVFADSEFNSVLPVDATSTAAEDVPEVTGTEEVPVVRLDSLRGDVWDAGDRVALKVDVQGLEMPVLDGAAELIEAVAVVEVELSAVPLYEGQALLPELAQRLYDAGFVLASLRPITALPNGHLLQADGIFVRRESALRTADLP